MSPGILRIFCNNPAVAFLSIPIAPSRKMPVAFHDIRNPAVITNNLPVLPEIFFPILRFFLD
jgi:hypothetical protein